MESICDFMAQNHHQCDELLSDMENVISGKDWADGTKIFARFQQALETHLKAEEEILFPAIVESGGPGGPIQVMEYEHAQMRELLSAMNDSVIQKDAPGFLGNSETLMMLIQQHNMKEEHMLYPMADSCLAEGAEEVVSQLREFLSTHG